MRWFHVQWNTYGTWLPGDPRGFRNRDHRIHSSGDYKHPPSSDEHRGLHVYALGQLKREPVVFNDDLKWRVVEAIVEKALEVPIRLAALAVGRKHVHVLMKAFPQHLGRDVGKLKRASSHAIRDAIPGVVWGAKHHPEPVKNLDHFWASFRYILDHEVEEGAVVWKWAGPCSPDDNRVGR